MSPFALPTLAPAIPDVLVPRGGQRRPAALARFLLDAGVIPEDQPARTAARAGAVAQQQMQRWLDERVGELKCLSPHFTLYLSGRPSDGDPATGMEATIVWGAEPKVWVVGPALERLEAICPGLGAIVLSTVESQGWLSMPVFTPWEGLGVAQYLYWYGEDNEELAVEEHCGEDQDAREAMLDTMVTRATVSAAFPAWAIKHGNERKALGVWRLRRIGEAAASAKVRRVAQATLALRELALDRRFVPEVEGDFTGHVAILTWAREPHDDLLLRIYDDFNELACQAEHYDWCGEQQFDLAKPEQFAEWATAMQPRFDAIHLVDTLIHELSTGDWSRTPKGIA